MSEPVFEERCADCPGLVIAEQVPVLGPFIGLVGSVLCGLAGALLLLAPFAFDYRQGAGSMPRSSVVDLATGGGVLVIGVLAALMFGGSLRRRLRASVPVPSVAPLPMPESVSESPAVPEQPQPRSAPAPAPAPEPQPVAPVGADPGGALRDLLTPLVAALAADLRSRENAESEGRQS